MIYVQGAVILLILGSHGLLEWPLNSGWFVFVTVFRNCCYFELACVIKRICIVVGFLTIM